MIHTNPILARGRTMARRRNENRSQAEQQRPQALEQARELLRRPQAGLTWHHRLGSRLALLLNGGEEAAPRSAADLAKDLSVSLAQVYQHAWFGRNYRPEAVAV